MQQQAWAEQSHVDISALAQRVTGLENGVQDIKGIITELAKKLDARPTNWFGIIGAQVGVLTVIGGAITFLVNPINSDISRHEHEISHIAESAINRSDYLRDREETERWIGSLRDRQRFNEDRGVFKDDLDRLEKLVTRLAESAATKADLAEDQRRGDERINTLAGALHELQHDFAASRVAPPAK